jgi:S1-C subfamily serine protease
MKISVELENVDVEHKSFEFSATHKEIVVGRNPESDIVLPAFDTRLSRHHLSLEEKLGRYNVFMQSDNPVYLDGERLHNGTEIPDRCVLALGAPDGPRLSINVERDANEALPETDYYTPQAHPGKLAALAGKRSGLNRAIVALLAVVVLGGGGFYFWQERQNEIQIETLVEQMTRFSSAEAVGDQEDALPEALRAITPSVYLVGTRSAAGESGLGTAWVVEGGRLATNAHVAAEFANLAAGQQMFVRATSAGHRTHVVTEVAIHPGYEAFIEFVNANPRVTAGSDASTGQIQPVGGYDVALLTVEDAEALAPPIPIADDTTLQSLSSGHRIGYAGFPQETHLLAPAMVRAPEPVLQMGSVTSLTDFFGVKPEDQATADLVQHNLPAHGGASGSPIINEKGEAVAILSAGNMIDLSLYQRIPSGIGIWFGQRADLVRQMIDGSVDTVMMQLPSLWERQLEPFDRYSDIYTSLIDALVEGKRGDTPSNVLEERKGQFTAFDYEGTEIFIDEFTLTLEAGKYLAIAGSPSGQMNLLLILVDATNEQVGEETNPIAHVSFTLTERTTLYVGLRSETGLSEEYLFRLYAQNGQT